jgi:hypothetical protein
MKSFNMRQLTREENYKALMLALDNTNKPLRSAGYHLDIIENEDHFVVITNNLPYKVGLKTTTKSITELQEKINMVLDTITYFDLLDDEKFQKILDKKPYDHSTENKKIRFQQFKILHPQFTDEEIEKLVETDMEIEEALLNHKF